MFEQQDPSPLSVTILPSSRAIKEESEAQGAFFFFFFFKNHFRVPGLITTALSAHPLLHGPISAQITSCPAVAANQSSAAPTSPTSLFML